MSISQKRANELDRRGAKDASNGKAADRPHGIKSDLTTWTKSGMEKNREENEIYRAGYDNTKSQIEKS